MLKTSAVVLGVTLALVCLAHAQQTQPPSTPAPGDTGSTNLPERVIVTGMVAIPDVGPGAPRFTAKDVSVLREEAIDLKGGLRSKLRRCSGDGPFVQMMKAEIEAADLVASTGQAALKATEAAEAARRGAAAGNATMQEVETAELKRQEAVQKMEDARLKLIEAQAMTADFQRSVRRGKPLDTGELLHNVDMRAQAGWGLGLPAPGKFPNLAISEVQASIATDKKGEHVVITGLVRNNGGSARGIPDLSVALADSKGWPLVSTTMAADPTKLVKPGEARPFRMEVRPAPQAAHHAVVIFANEWTPPPRVNSDQVCFVMGG